MTNTLKPVSKDTIFFWGGPFSQWHAATIKIEGQEYSCNEQYMMAEKARLFGDTEMLEKIMATKNPRDQKAYGRKVKNFDPVKWNEISRLVVYRANWAKFTQNDDLNTILAKTMSHEIVEASPEDCIWGIGLSEDNPDRFDRSKWRGTNWLGEAIMQVRWDYATMFKMGMEAITGALNSIDPELTKMIQEMTKRGLY